jgi:leader peptidase (prepilin peptidase)/N-methyltransferase
MNDFARIMLSENIVIFLVFLIGIGVGSFLNVCIYRLPRKEPITFVRSKCPICQKKLSAVDLLPVVSYVLLRGRCRYCKNCISARYPLVEILTAGLFLLCYAKFQLSILFFMSAILTSFLIVISFIDIDNYLIFDEVLIWLICAGILLNALAGQGRFMDFLIAAVLGGGFFFLISWITNGMMGLGDAKLAFAVGLWLGGELTMLALFLSFLSGAVVGIALLIFKIKKIGEPVPFGPFIAAGTFFSFVYGREFIEWWSLIFNGFFWW